MTRTTPKLVTDDEMQEAAAQASLGTVTEADLDRAEAEVHPDPESQPAVIPAPLSGLPSPNINHSASWAAETMINLQRFQNGRAALMAELEGVKAEWEKAEAERIEKHGLITRDLLERIKDMDDGIAMCSAAIDKADEIKETA